MSTQIHSSVQTFHPVPSSCAYIVGRDEDGLWVAVETHGRGGGLFRNREAAADFAAFETEHRPDAVQFASEPVSLRI